MADSDDTAIINKSLARIGAAPITSTTDATPKARQCVAVYYDRIDALLGRRQWSFADHLYKLDGLAEIAANQFDTTINKFDSGWRYAYALPGTRLSLPHTVMTNPRQPDDPLRDFKIIGGVLYADRSPIWAVVTVRANPTVWPPDFRLAAIVAVASDLCVPITQDVNLAATLREEAEGTSAENGGGGLVGRAATADAVRARPGARQWRDPLTEARFG